MRFLLLLLILPLTGIAQTVGTVENAIDSISSTDKKIEYLNDWTGKNYRKQISEAEYYVTLTIHLAKETNNHSGLGNAYIRMALINSRKDKNENALKNYNDAILNFKLSNDLYGLHKTYINRGYLNRKLSKHEEATKDFHKGINYFTDHPDPMLLANAYNGLGIVHRHLKNYSKALEYYNKSAEVSKKNNLHNFTYNANTNIANVYSLQGKYKEAMLLHKQNLKLLEKRPSKYKSAQTYHNIGACFLEMEQFGFAQEYLEKSLVLKEEIGNKYLLVTTLNGLSYAYYMQYNFDKSLSLSRRALALGKEVGNIEIQKNTADRIFKIFAYKNNPDSVVRYVNFSKKLRDSLHTIKTLQQVAEIQTKYETEKKEAQIALLEKENNSKAMQRNGLIVILILILGYAGFILYSYYRNKKLTRLLSLQKSRIEWSKEILDHRNQELRISNQTKNKLFQIISHDLRSPLASVSGISNLIQILLRQGRYQELDETSQDLNDCVTRVLNLTDNLLSWSLNQSGKLPFTPVVIPVKNLLSGIIEIYKAGAQQKNILLELSISQNLFVYADRPMLETVVRNLLNNALKFTPEGGLIILGAEMVEDHTEIWVEDNGVGIPDDTISNIFELDASSSGTRGEKGNGLGLILCKDFIEKNQGEIWVDSKAGKGTTFRFSVPNAEKIYTEESISHQ
ncbi:tetratricopeptide repeat-containing sensor histidine kinase [Marinifilum caeruleilacunae]|uniref:histidine kinase n=1 Tax=Marinifilum caeruleilacunae TaxID=2499076 RepID=A0ABX1WR97_9BACT|nr:tetratricopeptide repeat-containing sensor histidine kinase [Marinifilum caeruleilacunae]NOU58581.1 sensor histidine kinase [Marinifilum caeruleilacunae]